MVELDALRHRIAELEELNRRNAESAAAATLSEARLAALYELSQRDFPSEKELIDFALEEGVRLTGSRIGYFHFVCEDQENLDLFTWSREALKECSASSDRHYPLSSAGVWADAARLGKPVLHNDYPTLPGRKGLPEGHSPVLRHLSVPVIDNGRTVLVAGVANKEIPYNDGDVRQLHLFMDGVWRIITRRRIEEELRESREAYRSMFENNHAVMLLIDPADGSIVDANPAACSYYGYDRNYLLSRNISDINVLDNGQILAEMELARTEQRNYFNFRHRLAGGEVRDVEVFSSPVTVGQRQLLYSLVVDVTERTQAEQALRRSEENYRGLSEEFNALLDAIPDRLLLLDANLKVMWANNVALSDVACKNTEIIGLSCFELWHRRTSPCEGCPVQKCLQSGGMETGVIKIHDGGVWDVRAVPVNGGGNAGVRVIALARDISDQRKLEEQLLHSQKMDAVGQLAGGVAHDFNNILTAIIGYANLLQMQIGRDDPLRPNVEQIISASYRAASMTQSLLTFSRKQVVNPRLTDLNDIVRSVERLLGRLIGEDIVLETSVADHHLPVVVDAGTIDQVLINLVTNSRDAMPQGGHLLVATSDIEITEAFVRAHGFGQLGRYACISVTDTGIGMTEQTRKKIFEPFFTTKEVGKGTGLGLSITYGVVKQHNGFINCYSEPGRGTTFRVYLPLSDKWPMAETGLRSDVDVSALRGTETVLVAEDDEVLRRLAARVLTDFGYRVIEAHDGEDALGQFKAHKGQVDLLLVDVIMPKMNGREASDAIGALDPNVKVLFMSGYTADIIQRKGLIDTGADIITKPISPVELLGRVRAVLGKGRES